MCIAATASLWFALPTPSCMTFALVAYAIGGLAFELALVFYNARLERSPQSKG